jgi:hypothetical protein
LRERRDFEERWRLGGNSNLESYMRPRLYLSALIAISLIGANTSAFAQGARARAGAAAGAGMIGIAPGTGTVPPVGTTTTTGLGMTNNPGISQPGVPNTATPGMFGTGASPSGLPGDDPNHPGFPGRVGR